MLVRYNDAGLSSLWNRERPLPVSRQKGFWVDLSKSLGIVFKILCCILWNALRCHLMDISFGKLVFIWIPWMWLFLCVCFTCCASSDCVCYSFCFHFCEPGMEKAWQQWRLWEIKTTWQGYEKPMGDLYDVRNERLNKRPVLRPLDDPDRRHSAALFSVGMTLVSVNSLLNLNNYP